MSSQTINKPVNGTPPQQKSALRLKEAARHISTSPRTFQTLRHAADFPPARELSPRCLVWLRSELDEWLISRAPRVKTQPPPPQLRARIERLKATGSAA